MLGRHRAVTVGQPQKVLARASDTVLGTHRVPVPERAWSTIQLSSFANIW
jgi:hypothetical protein